MIQQTLPFCLASSSPRRSDLLSRYGFKFDVYFPDIDESVLPNESPKDYVVRLAKNKAKQAQEHYPQSLILSGDTIVIQYDQILGKPQNYQDAKRMLNLLNGGTHDVYSGYCLAMPNQEIANVVETKIIFYQLNEKWIEAYLATGESFDKAGAYSIQGLGATFVKSIQGSFYNVVGFPIEQILQDLIQEGCAVWKN